MTQIEIISVNRQLAGYIELTYKMRFTLPAVWGTGANPIVGLEKIVAAYGQKYGVEVVPVVGTVVTLIEGKSYASSSTQADIRTSLQTIYGQSRTILDSLSLGGWDNVARESWDGSSWTAANLITDNPIIDNILGLTATGANGAAVTLTIPATPGKFHNIIAIHIVAYSTAARTGGATPVIVPTTNISGTPTFLFQSAAAVGTKEVEKLEPNIPIKSLTSNTATTIACPATANVIWRVNVVYKLA